MQLYMTTGAPNPRRVAIFLAEKGITVPTVEVNLTKLEHWQDEFVKLHPRRRVPVLELDDGTVIAETIAICRYFEAVQGEPRLFGTTPTQQGVVEMWQRMVEIELLMAIQFAFRHLHPRMAEREQPQVKEWGEANKPKVRDFLNFLDGQLDSNAFVAGADFSVADITAFVAMDFAANARIEIPDELKNIARWRAQMAERPSFKA
ncbi:MAG: glutathione S-transferase [Rhizobiales bacterium 24-66-13]|jgi:glutathione S-transferase|nr:MAG: glutathione S-transferase [Rhizobiales bacterium 12-66-7]OYZ71010.1 MAG: glutathione S-transferase [Rhizobiales bacterium 24-66-13]OZB00544.1 MAG: glutathione S-transferase [Rhizobiales bacterium 39-66-18]HQS09835.1 glutathione S-transferase [Xanthobacteraceae bacterium]HQS48355.1 glutathione S-transferase [Xanthobacteraceae bacterium]